MRATLVFCFGCSTGDAATERIFLIIHNFRIYHPNNLKFWEKLLCTYMSNFPAGSFLYHELPPILFVGKVIKTRTTARINLLLNIYKQSNIGTKFLTRGWSRGPIPQKVKRYRYHGQRNVTMASVMLPCCLARSYAVGMLG